VHSLHTGVKQVSQYSRKNSFSCFPQRIKSSEAVFSAIVASGEIEVTGEAANVPVALVVLLCIIAASSIKEMIR